MVHRKQIDWPEKDGEWFHVNQSFSTSVPGRNGWMYFDDSTAGAPTIGLATGGGVTMALAADSEAEVMNLYQGDFLPFTIAEILKMEFYARVSGIDAATVLTMGLASARNTTDDSIVANAWFRMQGSASLANVVVESDDGTNDNDDIATGTTLAAVTKKFEINFLNGLASVQFKIDNSRVASGTTFDMSNYSGGLQPFFQLQKASGTGVPSVTIEGLKVMLNRTF